MRVLIVEDSDSICRMIEALVSARGFEVAIAKNGTKALAEAFARVPDVVLLDINLPGSLDGIEVCRKLRQNPLTRATPILFISAMTDEDARRRAHEAGGTAYYTKPFSPIALLKEIESVRGRTKTIPGPT